MHFDNQPLERFFDPLACLGRNLYKAESTLIRVLCSHLVGDLTPLELVLFVANQHADDSVVRVLKDLLVPLLDGLEARQRRHIVDEKGTDGPAEEKRGKRVEFLLS